MMGFLATLCNFEISQNACLGTSLVVQWLRHHASNAGGPGSIPGQGTRSHMLQLRVRILQLKILHVTAKILRTATRTRRSQKNKKSLRCPYIPTKEIPVCRMPCLVPGGFTAHHDHSHTDQMIIRDLVQWQEAVLEMVFCENSTHQGQGNRYLLFIPPRKISSFF